MAVLHYEHIPCDDVTKPWRVADEQDNYVLRTSTEEEARDYCLKNSEIPHTWRTPSYENHSVVQSWLSNAPLRVQATVLSALRGCDGMRKEDPSKPLTRELRRIVLNPADPDWKSDPNNSFMRGSLRQENLDIFLADIDHYPVHWLMHFMHSIRGVSIYHPNKDYQRQWTDIYRALCNRLHLPMEHETDYRHRLRDGRRTPEEERGARAQI